MKRILALLSVAALLCGVGCAPKKDPAIAVEEWVNTQIENNTLLSFDYNGTAYAEHIGSWEKTVESTDTGYTVTYKKDGVAVWSEIKVDRDANAVDWVHYFKNEAQADSAVISNIQALDAPVEMENPIFTGAKGCNQTYGEFEPFSVDLVADGEYVQEEMSGYSSRDNLPYWDLTNGEVGVMGAIGWTGDRIMKFVHNEGVVRMTAGMLQTKISLHANEQMRTPSIVLQFFTGDQDAGHNAWRQLVLKSYTPSDKTGQPLRALPIAFNIWGGAGASSNINAISTVEDGIFDLLWLDAGWYGDEFSTSDNSSWQNGLGDWYVSDKKYPNGLAELGDAAAKKGMDYMVWMEFERATPSSWLYQNYPQYFMTRSAKTNSKYFLYNLADDEATDFMIDLMADILQQAGADWYRTDSGSFPRYDWREMDALAGENRTGMTEIKWVTNLYRVFDTLRERIPGLMIDICAGGGRRLDVEMIRRGVPLWRTDYSIGTDDDDAVRYIAAGLTWWLPLSCGGAANFDYKDEYSFRSMFGTGLTVGNKVDSTMLNQFLVCRDLMVGDYYMLSHTYNDAIAVYEFIDPETDEGVIMAFRPDGCKPAKITCQLKGLNPEKNYRLDNDDTGASSRKTGAEWMEDGLTITLTSEKESALIYINRKIN